MGRQTTEDYSYEYYANAHARAGEAVQPPHNNAPNGSQGQRKLIDSRVLVIGAGGLGGPVALYLALAGVGTIGIVDFDIVDLSNLQRQVLHNSETIGLSKLESAKQTLSRYNPNVQVVAHEFAVNSDNAMELMRDYDVIAVSYTHLRAHET